MYVHVTKTMAVATDLRLFSSFLHIQYAGIFISRPIPFQNMVNDNYMTYSMISLESLGYFEPRCVKTSFLHMRKQRRSSAAQ